MNSQSKKRIFIGIPLPQSVKDEIKTIQKDIKNANWIPFDNLHATLIFIGSVSSEQVENIKKELAKIKINKFFLSLKEIGFWPPSILMINAEAEEELFILRKEIENCLLKLGHEIDTKPFTPHVTIARPKEDYNRDQLHGYLEEHKNLNIDEFLVEQFTLFESVSSEAGMKYVPLAEYELIQNTIFI